MSLEGDECFSSLQYVLSLEGDECFSPLQYVLSLEGDECFSASKIASNADTNTSKNNEKGVKLRV